MNSAALGLLGIHGVHAQSSVNGLGSLQKKRDLKTRAKVLKIIAK